MMSTGNDAANESHSSFGSLSVADTLLDTGFVLMLAWHYLVLFSSVFGDLENGDVFDYCFARQLVLYLSLAATFGGVWLFGRFRDKRGGKSSASSNLVYASGLFASVASGLYAAAAGAQLLLQLQLVLVAFLGASEGLLMCLWLRCFVERRGERFSNSFAIDMIAGGLLALLICLFQWPIGPVAAVVVPLLSSLVLAREKSLARSSRPASGEEGDVLAVSGLRMGKIVLPGESAGGGSLRCQLRMRAFC